MSFFTSKTDLKCGEVQEKVGVVQEGTFSGFFLHLVCNMARSNTRLSFVVLTKRSAALRLGPLQATDKNEDAKCQERENSGAYDARKAHGPFFVYILSSNSSCEASASEGVYTNGFKLAQKILDQIQRNGENRITNLDHSIGNDKGGEESSGTAFGNLKSVSTSHVDCSEYVDCSTVVSCADLVVQLLTCFEQ